MRKAAFGWVALAVVSALPLGFVACGGSTDAPIDTTDASANDATTRPDAPTATDAAPQPTVDSGPPTSDGGPPADAVAPRDGSTPIGDGAPFVCGAAPCTGGDVCCATFSRDGGVTEACMASCPDGGATLSCDGPANCTAAAPYCCAAIQTGAGTPPQCPIDSVTAACAATCTTQFGNCGSLDTARLCKAAADCADDKANPNCCELRNGSQVAQVCVSDAIKTFGRLTCL